MWIFVFFLTLLIHCLSFPFWYYLEKFLKKKNLLNNVLENIFYLFKYNIINSFYFVSTAYSTLLNLQIGEKSYLELVLLYNFVYILGPLITNLIIIRYLNDKCRFNLISLLIILGILLITNDSPYVLLFAYFCISILNIIRIRKKGIRYFDRNSMQNILTSTSMLTAYGLYISSLNALIIKYWYLFK